MGIFDLGFDAPDSSGWETRVTPGAADANNLSLAERIRATLTGSTDPSKQGANLANTASKMFGAASGGQKPPPQQQAPAATAPPTVPGKPMLDPQQIAAMGRSPFAAASTGAPKPAVPKIYQTGQQSPFGAA